ncbi:MAG TPA: DNA-formamidopyrimidine glycosylase family protein [Solimonas sp.]|nr:DNA-formamidopyrimidine glycosylase family protein [Solimonas sp.]
MPEGPSIVILREEVAAFAGQKVLRAQGNTKVIDPARLVGQKVLAFRSWGKHFLIAFGGFSLRVHFMLFGRYRINERKEGTPRLSLGFRRGELNLYACSVRWIEQPLDEVYDWSADVMADAWSPRKARNKLKLQPMTLACDALLDQQVFAGVGNIIKNEVLYRIRVHPESRIGQLPSRKLGELIRQARVYSFDFYEWKKAYVLRKHWQVHAKKTCPRCAVPLDYRKHLGKTQRRAFFCGKCQVLYR